MGNQQSADGNEVQALLNGVRRKAGEAEIDVDVETAVSLIIHNIEKSSTVSHDGGDGDLILQNLKLKFISEIIKTDKVETFVEVIENGYFKVAAPLGRLQLTPLHLASFHNSFKILNYLLQLPQILVNIPNKEKDTPLNLGLFNCESDTSAVEIIRTFQARKDLNIFCKNQKRVFPLLITIQKRFTSASKLLLSPSSSSSKMKLIDQYETCDLINVIKLALITNQDGLIHLINQNLGNSRKLQILVELQQNTTKNSHNSRDLLDDLVSLIKKTLLRSTEKILFNFNDDDDHTQMGMETLTVDSTIRKPEIIKNNNETSASVDSNPTTEDAGGSTLRIGNIVKTLSVFYCKRGLPSDANDADVVRVAEKVATIHEISGNKIYLEIHGEHCIAKLKAEAAIFQSDGMSKVIGDGSLGRIGAFVQVLRSEVELKELAGTVGWIHGMEDTCGRTGRIVRILENYDMLVQFAWGPRFYFKPEALFQSSSDKVETQDFSNNWIQIGSLVQIKKIQTELMEIQHKNNLPYDESYGELSWKFAFVSSIRLAAFSSSKTVKIINKGKSFLVNVECIELVTSVKDRNGDDIQVGNSVQVLTNKLELKEAQKDKPEFGGWVEEMTEVLGQVGKVVGFSIHQQMSHLNAVMAKVQFCKLPCFFFNPRAVTFCEAVDVTITPDRCNNFDSKTTVSVEDEWEQIPRDDLKCFEELGKGAFGSVLRAEWTKNTSIQNVAVKQIKPRVVKGMGPLEGVLKEAKIQFSLRHPNIVTLFGISLDKDLWIIMDLVDGTNLYEIIFPFDDEWIDFELTFDKKVKYSLDMCNAIAYIHQRRYIHCDIKPHNMMVDRRSGKLFVCDFGITKFTTNSIDLIAEMDTQYTNSAGGTTYYMAPECLRRNEITSQFRRPTFASDIWALGAVFFELFTQMRLYTDFFLLLPSKMSNDDKPVKKQLPNLPPSVLLIVSKALDFDRKARPTAQDLCEFFHELLLQVTTNKDEKDSQDKWEKIDRSTLKCFEVIREGFNDLLVRGEWNRNGNRQMVAIRQIKNKIGNSDSGSIKDALKDVEIQFSLRHPNIVALLGISVEQDLWIVMDFVDGTDLNTILFPSDGSDNSLTFNKKLKLTVDMCSAIAYMHNKGYLHRDVKPHSMLVDEISGKLYVSEFGSARYLGVDSNSVGSELTTSVSGNVYYNSPECLQPDKATGNYRRPTFAADIWALGLVLYELFTRKHLYDDHLVFLQDKLVNSDTLVKTQMAELPIKVRAIVSKALNFDCATRPSAQELYEFFQELL